MFKQFFKTLASTLSLDAEAAVVGDDLVVKVSVTYGDITLLEEEFVYDDVDARNVIDTGRERRLERRAGRKQARAERKASGSA